MSAGMEEGTIMYVKDILPYYIDIIPIMMMDGAIFSSIVIFYDPYAREVKGRFT